MTEVGYIVSGNDTDKTVTAYINGEQKIASKSNPNFENILVKLFEEDYDGLADLFEPEVAIERKFKKITERVSVSKGQVFFDMTPIENTLSEQLMRLIREGNKDEDIRYLVNFWEKLAANPHPHARENLMRWLNTHDFSITPDGDVVGYKGLLADGTSIHAGPGVVNGTATNGHLSNAEGNIVEIDREKVVQDSTRGCAFGLHVGTQQYASTWSGSVGIVAEITFNPRDAVSVPTDSGDAKVRVCRYIVRKHLSKADSKQRTEAVVDYSKDNDFVVQPLGSEWQDVGYTTDSIGFATDWNSK